MKILVVWDRERPRRSPRSEIETWWTEFSNIIFGFIFFFWIHVLSQICEFVFVILWICVWKRNSFLFFFFFLRLYGHGLRPLEKALKWLTEPTGLDVKKNLFMRVRVSRWGSRVGFGHKETRPELNPLPFLYEIHLNYRSLGVSGGLKAFI